MKRQWRPPRGVLGSDGAAAVEFALVLPLLLLLTIGMIDVGLLLHRTSLLTSASREGARAGIVQTTSRPTASVIETTVRSVLMRAGLAMDGVRIFVRGAGGSPGSQLAVLVEAPHRFLVLGHLVPGIPTTMTLRSQTVMTIE
ncbi:MAG: pilus assembly protein [Nitrospira sp.]|nr:pilus assembly protein [Nitrospira sp.]